MERQYLLSGKWYSADKKKLKKNIYLANSRALDLDFGVVGGVVPHAGHYYSSRGLAHFFNNLDKDVRSLIIFSPSHYHFLKKDKLYTSKIDKYQTPLGPISGFSDFSVESYKFIELNDEAILMEHAVEVLLPFIKNSSIKEILVFMVPSFSEFKIFKDVFEEMKIFLKDIISFENCAFLASSDFTHYGPRFDYTIFDGNLIDIEEKVKNLDLRYAKNIANFNIELLLDEYKVENPTICGFFSTLFVSYMMKSMNRRGKILDYYNSNILEKERSENFVSYCSIVF